jgi:hypothetical protein
MSTEMTSTTPSPSLVERERQNSRERGKSQGNNARSHGNILKRMLEVVQPPVCSLSYSAHPDNEDDATLKVLESVLNENNKEKSKNTMKQKLLDQEKMESGFSPSPLNPNQKDEEREEPESIRDIICQTKKFYRWACITGIIMPDNSYSSSTSFFFKYIVVKFRFWSFYMHFALLFQTIFMIFYLFYYVVTKDKHDSERKIIITTVQSIGFVLQNFLLYPAIVYLRKEILAKRDKVDKEVYMEAMNYAISVGRYIFVVFTILELTFVALECSFVASGNALFSTLLIIGIIFFFTPANFFLLGLLTFLIYEQRLSLHTMKTVEKRIVEKDFSYSEYFLARESIDKRDRMTPINWLLSAGMVNTFLAILLLFVISEYKTEIILIFGDIFFILSGFGRQIVVLVVILFEIVKVNEIADGLLKILVKSEWFNKDVIRLNLYVAMKDCPMGSTIFYFRPSKFQLSIQIASSIVGMGIAIFWAVIFA